MKQNTTVSISQQHDKILAKLSRQIGVSKKEYLENSLMYFQQYSINPTEHKPPALEMEKIRKRIDQLIAFSRTQEEKIIKPACTVLIKKSKDISKELEQYADVATNYCLRSEISNLYSLLKNMDKESQNDINNRIQSLENAILVLGEAIDHKNKQGLPVKMKNLFG